MVAHSFMEATKSVTDNETSRISSQQTLNLEKASENVSFEGAFLQNCWQCTSTTKIVKDILLFCCWKVWKEK